MKSRAMRLAVGILAFTMSGLASAAHAQQATISMKFKSVDISGAAQTFVSGINSSGLMAGAYFDAKGSMYGAQWKGQSVTSIVCPAGQGSLLPAVNSSGVSVADECGTGAFWYWVHSWQTVPINPPCPLCPVRSIALNDLNQVVGLLQNEQQQYEGFTYDPKTNLFDLWSLPFKGDTSPQPSEPWGVNRAGLIALNLADPASHLSHSYRFDGKSFSQIDVPGARQSWAHGINNNGDIIYTAEDASGGLWGVLFLQSLKQFYWFNQPDGRKEVTQAVGLNDEVPTPNGFSLQVVGNYATAGSNQSHAFAATATISR